MPVHSWISSLSTLASKSGMAHSYIGLFFFRIRMATWHFSVSDLSHLQREIWESYSVLVIVMTCCICIHSVARISSTRHKFQWSFQHCGKKVKKKERKCNEKIHVSNHFEASPWNKSVIALDARQVRIACSRVWVGHSGRPRACGPRATLVYAITTCLAPYGAITIT